MNDTKFNHRKLNFNLDLLTNLHLPYELSTVIPTLSSIEKHSKCLIEIKQYLKNESISNQLCILRNKYSFMYNQKVHSMETRYLVRTTANSFV